MKTVVLGVSGGVDSSVSGLLLKEAGYNVLGVFMHNWHETNEEFCPAKKDIEDARSVCQKIGIPFSVVDFSREYEEHVFSVFKEELKLGRTPNPDMLCNREIKFGPFLDYALSIGADYVATGHYANVEIIDGKYNLTKAKDEKKDQTYFLALLKERQLKNVLFPLGKLKKEEVRKIAKENGLITAEKKDSTGICFVGNQEFRNFLSKHLKAVPGNIVLTSGKKIGLHDGLINYTIGQSKGLGIGGQKGMEGAKFVVLKKDLKTNELIVAPEGCSELYSKTVTVSDFSIVTDTKLELSKTYNYTAKVRHSKEEHKCKIIRVTKNEIEVEFKEPQRAIAAGQYLVLYKGKICLGGGAMN